MINKEVTPAERLLNVEKEVGPSVTVVAVTKYATIDQMKALVKPGFLAFGESRVQEAIKKRPLFEDIEIEWHMIGHLQSNKVKKAVQVFDFIQSVDSLALCQKISDECAKIEKQMPVLIQVNLAEDDAKFGFTRASFMTSLPELFRLSSIKIKGIMIIAPHTDNEGELRRCFENAKVLFDAVNQKYGPLPVLSMGMSGDYRVAVEEGSTMIRVGRVLTGPAKT
jgi:PLP dependent protein